jgi:site-specific DNA recombinase
MNGVAMPVAVYLRVSTEEQRERQSIATQRDFAERYCALHGLTVSRVYADDGVTGTMPLDRRPEGSQVLRDARLKNFDQLLVYKLDRLGRDTRLTLDAVAELEKYGVRIRSMTEEFDTRSATGRLMLTMLSGFAAHERDIIRERSVAGTNRVAQAGAWLGGIVPFGYRKVGEQGNARIEPSEEPIPCVGISEAEVIRTIFRMAAVERKSCFAISDYLNRTGVPCAYVRDDRMVSRGKRKARTSGVWRPGRVRNLLVSTAYKGRHEYGKRSPNPKRELIIRQVPAIVTEEMWQQAQNTLSANALFSKRNSVRNYLLRGLVKCGLCGLSYVGFTARRPNGKNEFYYRCTGKVGANGPYGAVGKRCPSKDINGAFLEQLIWEDVEGFLRNPSSLIDRLQQRFAEEESHDGARRERLAGLESTLAAKTTERDRILGLFRKGRIQETDLERQMEEIDREEEALRTNIQELSCALRNTSDATAQILSAGPLLERLRERLDLGVTFEVKRQIVEALIGKIRIDTSEELGIKESGISVTFRFAEPEQSSAVVLSRSYSPIRSIRIPREPQTIGDHIRLRRLALRLKQQDVAERLGVCEPSVFNWESNTSTPEIRFMPAIIEFLGFNPLPEGRTVAENLIRQRTSLGLTQRDAAKLIGVDPCTLARWERGERQPTGALLAQAQRFLSRENSSTESPVQAA